MKHVTMMIGVFSLILLLLTISWAQVKELPQETVTVAGTVETIDAAKRVVNVKTADGQFVAVDVPKNAARFNELKVGDRIKVTYSSQVMVRLKQPNEAAVDRAYMAKAPGTGEGPRPGGTVATHRIMTATISDIDRTASSITFVGPNNWKYSRRVTDPTVLDKVKVGDRVDIIWNRDATVVVE